MTLAIKRIRNFPPYLSYISTLITHKKRKVVLIIIIIKQENNEWRIVKD